MTRMEKSNYNIISAFHKSLRVGSDVHASIYWLYRMIEAGE
jgi:replication-associated recombination protein RarA